MRETYLQRTDDLSVRPHAYDAPLPTGVLPRGLLPNNAGTARPRVRGCGARAHTVVVVHERVEALQQLQQLVRLLRLVLLMTANTAARSRYQPRPPQSERHAAGCTRSPFHGRTDAPRTHSVGSICRT